MSEKNIDYLGPPSSLSQKFKSKNSSEPGNLLIVQFVLK